jgi:hypothetical protein
MVTASSAITVAPGALSTLTLTPTNVTVPVNGSQQITSAVADVCGNPLNLVPTYATFITGASISSTGLFSAGSTPQTLSPGLRATVTDGANTVSAFADVTVTAGAISAVEVLPRVANVNVGQATTFTARAFDALGNQVPGQATWSVTAGGGVIKPTTGVLTASTTAGTFANTVRATFGTVFGTSTVIVEPGPAIRLEVAPSTVTLAPGGTTTFSTRAYDANNNTVVLPVTWTANSSAGSITQGGVFVAGNAPGTYPAAVTASAAGGLTAQASVSVNAAALARLVLTPTVASTTVGGSIQFSAVGQDSAGRAVPATVNWSVVSGGGTVTSAGIFTAGSIPGTFANTVRAEANGITAFASVTVTAGVVSVIEVTPSMADIIAGQSRQFDAQVKDAFGNVLAVDVTWQSEAAAGSISATGLFTGGMPGTYSSGVFASVGTVRGISSIRVLESDGGIPVQNSGADGGVTPISNGNDEGQTASGEPQNSQTTSSGCSTSGLALSPMVLLMMVAALRRSRRG